MIRIVSILLIMICGGGLFGQCPTGIISIESQEDVDNFAVNYPGCTQFDGFSMFISGVNGPITNLDGMSQLESVSTRLSIGDGIDMPVLTGLENLVMQPDSQLVIGGAGNNTYSSVSNFISPLSNDFTLNVSGANITTLVGLTNAVNLKGFSVSNTSVTDLTGLEGIETVYYYLSIRSNMNLVTTSGLENIEFNGTINNMDLNITDNEQLQSMENLISSTSGYIDITVRNNNSLVDLVGLEGLTELFFVIIAENDQLENFQGLNNIDQLLGITQIYSNPSLQNFDGLQDVLIVQGFNGMAETSMLIEDNASLQDFSGFTRMGSISGALSIVSNPILTNLDGFEGLSVIFGELEIGDNEMLNDISQLSNVVGMTGVGIGPSGLVIDNNDVLINLDGLEGYRSHLNTSSTESYRISNNNSLENINALSQMNFTNISSVNLEIVDNPNLSVCNIDSVCELLANDENATITIANNAVNCMDVFEVADECGLSLNLVSGAITFDVNNDGCDPTDFRGQSILVETTNGVNTFGTFSNSNGNFQNFINIDGTVTTAINPSTIPGIFESIPENFDSTFVGFGNEDIGDFCLTATTPFNDLKVTLVPLNDATLGTNSSYSLIYENIGSTLLTANVSFTFDSTRQDFVQAFPTEDDIVGSTIFWTFANLPPFQSGEIIITMNTLAPPANQIGDILIMEALVEDEGDESPVDNLFVLEQTILGATMPNDLVVAEGSEIVEDEIGNYLNFVIRFQNLDADTAMNLQIETTLSENLDWNTLRPLTASHEYRAEIREGNEVSFMFEEINLPTANDNDEGSKGYIAFQARTLSSLEVGDQIQSSAIIIMDSDQPIKTETVTTTIISDLGVSENQWLSGIKLFPNPAADELKIYGVDESVANTIEVYNMSGALLIRSKNSAIDITGLSNGMYLVKIKTTDGNVVKKLIKE